MIQPQSRKEKIKKSPRLLASRVVEIRVKTFVRLPGVHSSAFVAYRLDMFLQCLAFSEIGDATFCLSLLRFGLHRVCYFRLLLCLSLLLKFQLLLSCIVYDYDGTKEKKKILDGECCFSCINFTVSGPR